MVNAQLSIIVTTYNWPSALKRVLMALEKQTVKDFEVIVADDGSTGETKDIITECQKTVSYPLQHCWQSDAGFQAGKIRNKAVAKSTTDYLVFIDGDCVPNRHFVEKHLKLREKGKLVRGTRLLLDPVLTNKVLSTEQAIESWGGVKWLSVRIRGQVNGLRITWPFSWGRDFSPQRWQGVKTCNLGVWRRDFLAVNGFDEAFIGWGFEDSDLVIRLMKQGIQRKSGKWATEVWHLWHQEQDRSQLAENQRLLDQCQADPNYWAKVGVDQYCSQS